MLDRRTHKLLHSALRSGFQYLLDLVDVLAKRSGNSCSTTSGTRNLPSLNRRTIFRSVSLHRRSDDPSHRVSAKTASVPNLRRRPSHPTDLGIPKPSNTLSVGTRSICLTTSWSSKGLAEMGGEGKVAGGSSEGATMSKAWGSESQDRNGGSEASQLTAAVSASEDPPWFPICASGQLHGRRTAGGRDSRPSSHGRQPPPASFARRLLHRDPRDQSKGAARRRPSRFALEP